ncbi:MAG: ATP-dependent exoDNAse (exonuclease V) beta subunit [Ilumatobacter sp.]|jgi:ATP-dependent exoDNAse (exonuclease V) beta subunit
MSDLKTPADQPARELISTTGLGQTLFVEAGAGTGKTTQLVSRIVNTVLTNHVPLSDVAAITFTEAAATELQARIRVAFEQLIVDPVTDDAVRTRCRDAVADADMAVISTVHGFASRILGEFSVAAGLPPRVSVLDEVSSQLAHERRWGRFVDRLHEAPEHEELLYRAALMEIPLDPQYQGQASFKDVAANFGQNWDRLDELTDATPDGIGPIDFSPFDIAVSELGRVASTCTDPEDKLVRRIEDLHLPEMRAVAAISDPHTKLRVLSTKSRAAPKGQIWGRGTGGKKAAWGCDVTEIKDVVTAVNDAAALGIAATSAAVVEQLMQLTAAEVVQAARARSEDGGLEFHDLLVLARRVLRRNANVRAVLHDRYQHILLDEFQDTDPIQIEVASLIASTPADAHPEAWQEHSVPAGRLFFVGDPKQSIYRFRRADIKLFLAARDAFGGAAGSVSLSTNFRTVAPIIDWVNGLFSVVMPEEIDGAQPKYEPLRAWRTGRDGVDHRPLVFGGEHSDPKVKAGVLREAEAYDVAAIISSITDEPVRWPVFDARSKQWRAARLSDVTVLIPTRSSLPFLRESLDGKNIPYRLATGTLVYDTQEVRDALAVLRSVDDPNDTVSLIAALRSPLYGCSDVDLFTYHQARRKWDLPATPTDSLDPAHPVVAALVHLRSLWEERWWLSPATLLERVLRERRAFIVAYGDPRPAEVWRRLRFLLDQARAFEESNGGGLRDFLDWAALQSADGARVHEPMLPETDEDMVQIITVHGSKGLEFPITILSGMTTAATGRQGGVSVLWGHDGPPEVKLRTGVATSAHQPRADLEEAMDQHEKARLLYVAATRARDHLVVSGHHKAAGLKVDATFATRMATFAADVPELSRRWGADIAAGVEALEPECDVISGEYRAQAAVRAPLDRDAVLGERNRWISERRDLLRPFERPNTLSATAIAATVDASIIDVDDDSRAVSTPAAGENGGDKTLVRRKGRAGSSIGRAVHATLEVIDFDDPSNLRELVDRQCDLESIPEHGDTVDALVRSALASEAVGLGREHVTYRELYVGAPLGGITVEGYIDLLIRTPGGLIIVDYKTDTVSSEAAIDAKVAAYELQGATYAVALETTTGLSVVDCRFVFCMKGKAVERSVADLDGAKERVRRAVSGRDAVG